MIKKKRFKDYFFLIASLVCVIAVMSLIFYFSSQDGNESSQSSDRVAKFVLSIVNSDFKNMEEDEQDILVENAQHIIRKLAHFTEFAMLGFFVLLHIKAIENFTDKPFRFDCLLSFAVGVLYAAGDEIHQSFSEARGPSVKDVLIDSSGVIAGTAAIVILFFLVNLFNKKKGENYAVH